MCSLLFEPIHREAGFALHSLGKLGSVGFYRREQKSFWDSFLRHHLSKLSLLTLHVASSGRSEPTQETAASCLIYYTVNPSHHSLRFLPTDLLRKAPVKTINIVIFRLSGCWSPLLSPLFPFVNHVCMCLCAHLCKQAHQIKYIRGGHYQFSGRSLVRSSLGHQGHGTGRREVLLLPSSMSGLMVR